MKVAEIVRKYLEENNYDGLVQDGDCGCCLKEFMPCGEMQDTCEAAYKWTPEQAAAEELYVDGEYEDFKYIMSTTPPSKES